MTTDLSDLLKQWRELVERENKVIEQTDAASYAAHQACDDRLRFLDVNAPRLFAMVEAAEGLEKALKNIADELDCSQGHGRTGVASHYCPNCDNSIRGRDEALAALSAFKKAKETE